MKSHSTLTILLLLLSLEAFPKNILYCSHPELCKMINQISENPTESLVSITGDPHEYEPSILEIKNLISAPLLITGPAELNPWIKKIHLQRNKIPSLQTISLLLEQKDYLAYPSANQEALSHFWLYPKTYCSLKNKLEKELVKLNHAAKKIKPCDFKKPEEALRALLIKIKKPIILTHDALLPLLDTLGGKGHTIVAIKASGHHEEASPQSIKKMYNAMASPQVIWIQEAGINIPQNIINKMRPTDIVIKIDTAKTKINDAFSVLNELADKLTPYAE